MARDPLSTYLNDHLAGAEAALRLLAHLREAHADTPREAFLERLHDEVAADRDELERLMERLGAAPRPVRKLGGRLGEVASEAKLRMETSKGGPLRLLEALDTLASGIEGKRALWTALAAAAEADPLLRRADFARLEGRALDQHRRVEEARLEAARAALAAGEGLGDAGEGD